MATSSKVQFNLEKLKEKALEALDLRISQLREIVGNYDSDEQYTEQVAAWRQDQIDTIRALADKVNDGTVTDIELEGFKLRPKPSRDRWQNDRDKASLRRLEAERQEMLAKAESLVPDADGNVSLTKTQLREFFSL